MSSEIVKMVKSEQITPKEGIVLAQKHATRLSDIDVNLNTYALQCGFPTIEKYEYLLSGEGNLVIMAARPGNGKTSLACQIGMNVAEHSRVLMFSLEMKKETLRKRLLSVLSKIPIKKLGLPVHSKAIAAAKEKQKGIKFDIIDDNDLSINDIKMRIYDENRLDPVAFVIIDYIGIVSVNNDYRSLSIGDVAKRLKKDVADKLRIPVLVLAQMNRGFDARKATEGEESEEVRPNLSDIGESSGIEHAADVVMFLHRPSLTNPSISPNLFRVYVAKNRNGEVKDFDLQFSQELTRFYDQEEI